VPYFLLLLFLPDEAVIEQQKPARLMKKLLPISLCDVHEYYEEYKRGEVAALVCYAVHLGGGREGVWERVHFVHLRKMATIMDGP